MNKEKLFESLIFISNLAIPPDRDFNKGLGDLLNLNNDNSSTISPSKFIIKNKDLLEHCYLYIKTKDFNWDLLLKNLNENYDFQKVKSFLEEFRVFAIKNYFSNPYVLKELSLLESDVTDDNIEIDKDKAILNSLINE